MFGIGFAPLGRRRLPISLVFPLCWSMSSLTLPPSLDLEWLAGILATLDSLVSELTAISDPGVDVVAVGCLRRGEITFGISFAFSGRCR